MAIWVIYFIIGSIGGFSTGLLGIGGGVIMIPMLTQFGQISIRSAVTVSLLFVIVSSFSGLQIHLKMRNIDISTGIWLCTSSIVGALLGVMIAPIFSDYHLKVLFSGIVLIAAVMLIINIPESCIDAPDYKLKKIIAVIIGFIKGIFTGMLGIGAGFILVPSMICLMKVPVRKAIGTSLLVTLISGIFAVIGKIALHEVLSVEMYWILFGAIPCSFLGGWLTGKIEPKLLKMFLFVLLVSIFFVNTFNNI